MSLKILLVDDHIMIVEGIKNILSYSKFITEIKCVDSIEKAYNLVVENNKINNFDLISIDLSMPPYIDKNIENGTNLAKLIRKNYPRIIIIILTGFSDGKTINELFVKINPNGFIEKSDLKGEDIITIFEQIISGKNYVSKRILLDQENFKINNELFDYLNLEIIQFLSNGFSTKSISEKLPLSLSAIKKRKQKIKQLLNIENGNDEDIVLEAIKRKIIN